MELWQKYKQTLDSFANVSKPIPAMHKNNPTTSPYESAKVFFLRETQLDIIKYAKQQNLSKILLLEDDILLADSYWFDEFCKVEPSIDHFALNLGVNDHYAPYSKRRNITNHHDSEFKLMVKGHKSFGAFAMA